MSTPLFHGTASECLELTTAVEHNCTCSRDDESTVTQLCLVCKAILNDQRYLDGVLAMRHLRARLQDEEEKPRTPEKRLFPYRGFTRWQCPCGCGREGAGQ